MSRAAAETDSDDENLQQAIANSLSESRLLPYTKSRVISLAMRFGVGVGKVCPLLNMTA